MTARCALPRSLGPLRLLPLLLLLAAAPLHAADICNGGTLPLCFDGGDPDLLSGSDVTRFTAADDFVLITNGEEVALRVDFWTLEGNLDWDETLEYFIFEDVADSQSQNGRSPAATPLYSGMGQAMTREFTGRTGEPALPEFKEYKYSFRLDGPVSLNSGQVYWLGLHLHPDAQSNNRFWETAHVEATSYPPGVGYGSLRHLALDSAFSNFSDDYASRQQLAFEIYENSAHLPSVSPLSGLAITAALMATGAAMRRRRPRRAATD